MGNYKKKYLQIYFWQILSFCLRFLSMFVVTPLITNMPAVYGIYSVCISLTIFLSYADLGFLMAGEKFAAESYSKNDRLSEKGYIGTSIFIYAVVCVVILIGVLVCAYNPSLILKDITLDGSQVDIARKLLLILAASIPITVFQKFVQVIYKIRLEDFKIQRVNILGSLLVILSVPFVFFNNKYDIVGYYLFSQIVLFATCCYNMIRSKRIGYGVFTIIKSIHLDKKKFSSMKGLASSGFIGSISWLLCFEMDLVLVSSMLGAQMAALYAIGRNLNDLFRSIFGIFYSPYSVRFNYFVGAGDAEGLRSFYYTLIRLFCYITVIPVFVFLFFAEPFVVAWVGNEYLESVLAVQILTLCFLPNYLTAPSGAVVIALNKFKSIFIVSILMPLVFYIGVFSLISTWNIYAVAFSKLMVGVVSGGYYLILVSKIFGDNLGKVIKNAKVLDLIIPLVIALVVCYIAEPLVSNVEKSPMDLFKVVFVIGGVSLLSLLSAFISDRSFRSDIFNIIRK